MLNKIQKAAAIAVKLELIMNRTITLSPERITKIASAKEINFYYYKLIEMRWLD